MADDVCVLYDSRLSIEKKSDTLRLCGDSSLNYYSTLQLYLYYQLVLVQTRGGAGIINLMEIMNDMGNIMKLKP